MKYKNLGIIITLFIIIIIINFVLLRKTFHKDIEIIVSRYNEGMEWINEYPFTMYKYIVYNKGNNVNFTNTENIMNVVYLKNEGRESHTYLYHIIKNYNNLAETTVFLPASFNSKEHRLNKCLKLMETLDYHRGTIFLGKITDFRNKEYNFIMENWDGKRQKLSDIRPFGKWHETFFPNVPNIITTGFGIFSLAKEDIIQHPISYYKNLIKQLEGSTDLETGHYFERSWYSVFYPYKNPKFIELEW